MELREKERYLKALKEDVLSLPESIWDFEDEKSETYSLKLKLLCKRIVEIDDEINDYIRKYENNNKQLKTEFSRYSFSPNDGFIYDPFSDIYNKAWSRGKKEYVSFIEKLYFLLNQEKIGKRKEIKKNLKKIACLLVIMSLSIGFFFTSNAANNIIYFVLINKIKLFFIVFIGLISIISLWPKARKNIFSFLTSIFKNFF